MTPTPDALAQPRPYIRAFVWAALAALALYIGVRIVAGPGRDIAFRDIEWTGGAYAQVLVLTAVVAGLFGRAAWSTWTAEIAPPPQGVIRVPGARLTAFGDAFLSLTGGLLFAVATFLILHAPEALLASDHPIYRRYHSASMGPTLGLGCFFGAMGFLLLILRRYVWELRAGEPIRRSWARAFSRGTPVGKDVRLYWTLFYVKQGYQRVAVAHWLRAEDPAKKGFFKDADIELVPLTTPPDQLGAIAASWQARFAQLAGAHHAITIDPQPREGAVA